MYSENDEAIGIGNGSVRVALWNFLFNTVVMPAWEHGRSIGQGFNCGVAFVE